jgi:hypothetical protein
MNTLYTKEFVETKIEKLVGQGYDRLSSIAMSVSEARNNFKKDHPDKSTFPKHLAPGGVISTYMKGGVEDG